MLALVFELLKLFAEGTLHARVVQRLAKAALTDGWGAHDELATQLAGLGTSGKHVQNVLRDLLRLSSHLTNTTPDAYLVEVPGPASTTRIVSVVLPHEQLQKVVEAHGAEQYRTSDRQWAAVVGIGPVLRQWGIDVGIDARDVLAIGVHADGVSYSSSVRVGAVRGVHVGSWNIISAEAATHRGQRHLSYAIAKRSMCDCGCEG
jgi:hypothetical protein